MSVYLENTKEPIVIPQLSEPSATLAPTPKGFQAIGDSRISLKGSSKTSSHLKGQAMDITSMGGKSNLEMFHWIKDNLDFDQLIWEFGSESKWLHVSFNNEKDNRNQILITKKQGVYRTWS